MQTITVNPIASDEEFDEFLGHYYDESHYSTIIKEDADVYNEKGELLLMFRKAVIPEEQCKIILKNLKAMAKVKKDNRGASAGLLDKEKVPKYVAEMGEVSRFRSIGYYNKEGVYINNSISNLAPSNIAGYFDNPNRNFGKGSPKCRLTAFTAKHANKWNECLPFFKKIDEQFKNNLPEKYQKQYDRSRLTDYFIEDTSFSTITLNHNWRTAVHKDQGDYIEGFGNFAVCEEGSYGGCYLGYPRYKVAVDVRQGDWLGFYPHEYHCNTEFKNCSEDYVRLSAVCYLREKFATKCPNTKNI
jgi:hypothetical protein